MITSYKYIIFLFNTIAVVFSTFANDDIYDKYYGLKNKNEFAKIEKLLSENKKHSMFDAFKWHSEYFSKGNYDNSSYLKINHYHLNNINRSFYYYLYGYHIKLYLPKQIEKSTEFFFKGLELAKNEKHLTLICEGLYLIIADLLHNENSHKLVPKYIIEYEKYANSDYHKFWAGYMKFMYIFSRNAIDKKKSTLTESDFHYLKKYTINNYYSLSSYYNLLGIHYNQLKNEELSNKYFKFSSIYNNKVNYYYAQVSAFSDQTNLASNLIEQNKCREGINMLKKANKKNMIALPFVINYYKNLEIAYEKLKMPDSALYYHKIIDSLNTKKVTIESNFHHQFVSAKFQLKEKNQQISTLSQKFNQNKLLYLTLILLVFLLALYSFIRWKKEDKKKKIIEDEKTKLESEKAVLEATHHQTIEELQKTKELVIEDHIVLKNNAKIYLEKLLYIKADDHYLELITTNKKEFVRGKISEIISQLPPNFVKCHRSFIVNVNYISLYLKTEVKLENGTLIPLSRGFVFK